MSMRQHSNQHNGGRKVSPTRTINKQKSRGRILQKILLLQITVILVGMYRYLYQMNGLSQHLELIEVTENAMLMNNHQKSKTSNEASNSASKQQRSKTTTASSTSKKVTNTQTTDAKKIASSKINKKKKSKENSDEKLATTTTTTTTTTTRDRQTKETSNGPKLLKKKGKESKNKQKVNNVQQASSNNEQSTIIAQKDVNAKTTKKKNIKVTAGISNNITHKIVDQKSTESSIMASSKNGLGVNDTASASTKTFLNVERYNSTLDTVVPGGHGISKNTTTLVPTKQISTTTTTTTTTNTRSHTYHLMSLQEINQTISEKKISNNDTTTINSSSQSLNNRLATTKGGHDIIGNKNGTTIKFDEGTTSSSMISNNITTTNTRMMDDNEKGFEYYLSNASTLLEDIMVVQYNNTTQYSSTLLPSCGFFKCFVLSQHYAPYYGYTIGQYASKMNTYSAEVMIQTYNFVKQLEHKYSTKFIPFHHLYHPTVGPVVLSSHTSKDLYQYMKSEMERMQQFNNQSYIKNNTVVVGTDLHIPKNKRRYWVVNDNPTTKATTKQNTNNNTNHHRIKKYAKSKDFLIQVLKTIPNDSFLFHAYGQSPKMHLQWNLTMNWLSTLNDIQYQQQENETDLFSSYWSNFDDTLHKYINQTLYILDNEPDLSYDFQIAIDPSGIIWHYDLDRALGHDVNNVTDPERQLQKLKTQVEMTTSKLKGWYKNIHKYIMKQQYVIKETTSNKGNKKDATSLSTSTKQQYKFWKEKIANQSKIG